MFDFAVLSLARVSRLARVNRRPSGSRFVGAESLEARRLLSTSYFVSASAGRDTNPGTLAQPLATIQAAAALAKAGDTVYVRAGVYRETVRPAHSGTALAPITFRPYGNESVTIDGADLVSGWSPAGGPIALAPQPWTMGQGADQVFVDGSMMTEARWPNTSLDVSHPYTATSAAASASVSSTGLSTAILSVPSLNDPSGAWVGATIHISPGQGWVWQTGTVISSGPGTLTYQYQQLTTHEVPSAGDQFYLTGKFQALDAPAEWYRDATTGYVYLWTIGSDSPANHVVEAKRRLFAFDLSGRSYVNVQGFRLFASTINTDAGSSHLLLSGINAAFVSQQTMNAVPWNAKYAPHTSGIILNGTYNTLENSDIAYSSGDGVFLGGSNNSVRNSTIHDADYAGGDEAGVSILGTNDQVTDNLIYNTGRSGVTHYFSSAAKILNNTIHDVGLQTSDAGGTYTWDTDGKGTEIGYNLIYNVHGSGFGNTGLFLDNNCSNFVLHHNVVYNADSALKLNPASTDNKVINNTLVGTQYGLGASRNPTMQGCVLANNIVVGATVFGTGLMRFGNIYPSVSSAGFVDPANGNFHLRAGSSAIDAGYVDAPYTNGFLGRAPDSGAYEFGVGSTPPRSARSTIEAESFSAQQGTRLQSPGVGYIDNGDWLKFSNIDFGAGVQTFLARVAVTAAYAGGRIEAHMDSATGPVISTLTIASTGAWTTFATQSAPASSVTGVHDLYLLFKGGYGICNLDWIQFA